MTGYKHLFLDTAIFIYFLDKNPQFYLQAAGEAARLRANYPSLKSMDALQLASAILAKSQLFLTNDKQLLQVTHIPTCTLEQYVLP